MNLRQLRCCRALPLALLLLCMAHFSCTHAMIASLTLRNSRLANTYTYTMYSGAAVTGETFFSGSTTYPYVFDSNMNAFVVSLLRGYLEFNGRSVDDVGGSLRTCMGSDGKDSTGKTCYKALLAATAPADCPAANWLCCPLFWRTNSQNIQTTMAEMDVETIFWNGAYAINGFFANFSDAYLKSNGNCSRPLFDDTTELSLAVDVTGEWRFVPLITTYVLQETVQGVTAEQASEYFGSNPQSLINATRTAQRRFYKVIDKFYIPVAVCAALLFIVWLFLLLTCTCNTHRAAKRVRRTQARLLELKAAPKPRGFIAILNEISPESSSRSSSEESRRSRRISVNRPSVSRHSRRDSVSSDSASSESSVSFGTHDDVEEEQESVTPPASRRQSGKSKGSTKSMKSKASTKSMKAAPSTKSLKSKNSIASRKSSKKRLEELNFPPRPDPLPGIRNRRNSDNPDYGGASQQSAPAAASSSASSGQRAKRPGSTATVVHQVNSRQNLDPNQNGWFA